MEYTVQIVEPELPQGKHIASQLIQAGYDARISSCARMALRQFFQVHPDAVVLGDGMPVDDPNWLGSRIRTLSDVPLIGLGDHAPRDLRDGRVCSVSVLGISNACGGKILEVWLAALRGCSGYVVDTESVAVRG